jgi:hypothetical protein
MTDDEISKFRASERERMAPMREAARKESFVQGFLRGRFGDLSQQADETLLAALRDADAAYSEFCKRRSPA